MHDLDRRLFVFGRAQMMPAQPERGDLHICLAEASQRNHSSVVLSRSLHN
jgi:hypothetical protein